MRITSRRCFLLLLFLGVLATSISRGMPEQSNTLTSAARPEDLLYTVQRGDTIESIGRLFVVNVDSIRSLNSIPQGAQAEPGAVIKIPADSDVPSTTEPSQPRDTTNWMAWYRLSRMETLLTWLVLALAVIVFARRCTRNRTLQNVAFTVAAASFLTSTIMGTCTSVQLLNSSGYIAAWLLLRAIALIFALIGLITLTLEPTK